MPTWTKRLTWSRYLLIDYYLADLISKDNASNRKEVLRKSQEAYERYLNLLDTYAMLNANERKLYERYVENRDDFSLISSNDPGARRDTKIARFKQENELILKLEVHLSLCKAKFHMLITNGSSSPKSL